MRGEFGQVFLEYIYPEDRDRNLKLFEPLVQRKKDHCLHEIRYLRKDGGFRWVEVHARLMLAPDGTTIGTAGTLRDISEHRRMALETERNRKLLAEAIEGSHLRPWEWNLETGRLVYDGVWLELLGYGPDEIEPHYGAWARLVHPDDSPRVNTEVIAHVKGKTAHLDTEYRIRTGDGSWRWIHTRASAVEWNANHRVVRITGIHADVTRRREAEDRLRATLAKNEKLVADLTEAVKKVRTLSGLLPMCAWCHKIRDDEGYWKQIEDYIAEHSEAMISHGLCPECAGKHFPD